MDKIKNKDSLFTKAFYASDNADYNKFKETNDIKDITESNSSLYKVDTENKNNLKAVILIVLSNFLYALTTIMHKYLYVYNYNISPFFQVTYKYVGYSIVTFVYLKISKVNLESSLEFAKNNLTPIIIRLVAGSFAGSSYVVALVYVNGTAIGVSNCFVPILTTILSSYLLQGQEYNKRDISTLFVCLFASFFIIDNDNAANKETSSSDYIIGFLLCALFTCSNSIRNAYAKVLYPVNLMLQIFIIGIFTIVVCIMLAPLIGESLFAEEMSHYFIMIFIGVFEIIPLYLNIYSLNIGDISVIMQFFYSYLPFVTILSYLLVGESITLLKLLGIMLILVVSIYRSYSIYLESKVVTQ
jgi:drug/metabolite transporter (DMT)-like permease